MLQSMNLMIYVDDVEKVAAFFEQAAGTPRISEETMIDGSKTITVPVFLKPVSSFTVAILFRNTRRKLR